MYGYEPRVTATEFIVRQSQLQEEHRINYETIFGLLLLLSLFVFFSTILWLHCVYYLDK